MRLIGKRSLLKALPRKDIQARHVTDVVDKFGEPTGATYTDFTMSKCTVQPYVGSDFILGTDGFTDKTVYTVFTDTFVTDGLDGGVTKPDEAYIYGKWFRCAKVRIWGNDVISHYECVFVEMTEGLI